MLEKSAFAFSHRRPVSPAGQFAALLDDLYRDLLEQGIPDNLAVLVRRLDGAQGLAANGRRIALVVEADEDDRSRAAVLLEETGLAVIECESASAAIGVLHHRAEDAAFVFADQHLGGHLDGVALAHSIASLWPGIRVVVTLENHNRVSELPPGVVALRKPWRGLDVLIEAERALSA